MFSYKNPQTMNNVVIIGCGGTGSRLLPLVSQIMSRGQWNDLMPLITLIDGDEVEVKNLTRQNFIREDVGRNKAECLAERYGQAFEIPILAIPEFVDVGSGYFSSWIESRSPQKIHQLHRRPTTIFLCVDNMEARFLS